MKYKGSEGPKRSVAKPTAAQSVAAKKRAAVKKSSAEGPKRSISKPTPLQTMRAKGPSRVVESGVGNVPMTIARAAIALVKSRSKTVTSSASGKEIARTKSAQQVAAKARANRNKSNKTAIKTGTIKSPSRGPKGFKGQGTISSKQKSVPTKYGYR
jgi:hypothetical protein